MFTYIPACLAGVIGEGGMGAREAGGGIEDRGEGTPALRTPFD